MLPDPEAQRPRIAIKRTLVACGWQEAVTFSFVISAWEAALDPGARDPVKRRCNPIAAHLDVMRTIAAAAGSSKRCATNVSRKAGARAHLRAGPRVPSRTATGSSSRCAWAGSPTARPRPSNGAQPTRARRLLRRQGRPRSAGRAANADDRAAGAPRAASRARRARRRRRQARPAGSASCIRGSSASSSCRGADRVRARPRRADRGALPAGRPVSRLPVVRRDLALVVDERGSRRRRCWTALAGAKPPHVDRDRAVRRLSRARTDDWSEKPCDSGAYAGYCTYFDRRRHRRDHGGLVARRCARSLRRDAPPVGISR